MPDITMSSSISKMLLTFSHPQPILNGLLLVGLILQNQLDSFVWFGVLLCGNGGRFSCLEFYSYYSIEQAFIKVSLSKRGLCSAHIPAKSRTMLRSASCLANSWAIALKCFLVIHYQRVGLYKGFFTQVEKGSRGKERKPCSCYCKVAQLPHHLGVADSLGWGCVATFNARAGLCHWPFAITCQATPVVIPLNRDVAF